MKRYLIIFFTLILWINIASGEETENSGQQDSTAYLSPVSAIWRSTLLPGWGQIYQERLANATLLYASSATFYYRSFFYLYRYNKSNDIEYYNRFKSNLSVAIFFHVLNLIDVTNSAYRNNPKGWQGGLLSDKPLKSPWGATLRSAILPGWGQVYNESYLKAAVYFAVDGYLFYKIRQADIRYRDSGETKYREARSKYSWYFGLAYLITMADAYAGAYLYKFDEAIELTIIPEVFADQIGLGLYVSF